VSEPLSLPASARVRAEWHARIAAEYTSAAITQTLTLWLMQLGAPPDLIHAGLEIVGDELVHSRMADETYRAAGGSEPPAIGMAQLQLEPLEAALPLDVLRVCLQSFCLGETVAVPLFSRLREGCTVAAARAALDRVLVDEVRHRDFGWDLLDWLTASGLVDDVATRVAAWLPGMLAELDRCYGEASPTYAAGATLEPAERAWGLAPTTTYAEILGRTIERDLAPRFAARGVDVAAAWAARASAA
jgi:hypothetical protein